VNEEALAYWWLSRQKQTENISLSNTQLYFLLPYFTFAYKFFTKEKLYFHIITSSPATFAD